MRIPTPGNLVAKLAVLLAAGAVTAGALLAVRQQRIMAAHDLIRAHNRMVQNDRALWRLRVEIGALLSPDRVEQLAGNLGPLRPITPDWCLPAGHRLHDKALAHRDEAEPRSVPR